jgi:hypothetical protein
MKLELVFIAVPLLLAVATGCTAQTQQAAAPDSGLAHTRVEFHFVADGSFEQVAPLFGANEERTWAVDWNPQFIYPMPAHDQAGMVFRVEHGDHSAIWINTAFDLAGGHIQYSYVLSKAMATLIDIQLTRDAAQKTGVTVVYERTALIPEANEHVQHFAKGDARAEKEWADAINGYLAKARAPSLSK